MVGSANSATPPSSHCQVTPSMDIIVWSFSHSHRKKTDVHLFRTTISAPPKEPSHWNTDRSTFPSQGNTRFFSSCHSQTMQEHARKIARTTRRFFHQ